MFISVVPSHGESDNVIEAWNYAVSRVLYEYESEVMMIVKKYLDE